jgi:type II secretory pathway pseudopilin PulG
MPHHSAVTIQVRHARARTAPTHGFTLIEVVIATLFLAVGLLGLAGTAAAVSRHMGSARRWTVAAHMAERRFEIARGTSCAALRGGSAATEGIAERWIVAVLSPRVAELVDTVVFVARSRGAPSVLAFRSLIRC